MPFSFPPFARTKGGAQSAPRSKPLPVSHKPAARAIEPGAAALIVDVRPRSLPRAGTREQSLV